MSQYKANNKKLIKLELNNLVKIIIVILDSFHPKVQVELLREQQPEHKNCWKLKSTRNYGDEKEIILSAEKTNELLNKLKRLELPEIEKLALGLDGTTYSIDFVTKSGHWFYEWWCDAPEGYAELDKILRFINNIK